MGKKLPHTPSSRIRSTLRQLFLRSRERAAVLKRANYTCECGNKQSKAKGRECKVEVHHRAGIDNWQEIIEAICAKLLNEDDMEVLCKECHDGRHENKSKINDITR